MELINCLIIGSGPSGYTAAIYASRANLKPVLYQGYTPGGQLTTTTKVENYPGYENGIMGPEMMISFEKQALNMGADIRMGTVTKVDFTGPIHKVQIDDGDWVSAKSVIISTGASAKWLGIESEKRLNGYGVSSCAICDGFFFKGKEIAVVGGGDTACEEALYLSNLGSRIHMIIRNEDMKASRVMQERVNNTKNILKYFNSEVVEILGDNKVDGVRIKSSNEYILHLDAVFIAIGHIPNSSIFKDWIKTDEYGYINTIPGTTKTNIDGVFAAGDVQDKIYKQAITAAGSGCMAALDVERYLNNM